ncbi:YqjF family protein [Cellulomonas marina]|uniref:DUF2071 domain-containing protein n=1 Tax=Cellulomonas marina TaxID=988821 RepID=A0A1I0WV48_9CELL|nr:DUF2071 domain-containing protein [Cellulomonas marina]GIG30320.1 hypothetical protein Cma02nite_29200 [Cellulomonas marina]SFA91813.1 hypothetical protein SAMN05421867_103213 [Cellulomonas marina]
METTRLLDGYPVDAPRLTGPVLLDQRWEDLAFVHRPVAPAAVARFFPPGTRPDIDADGRTWVGYVPFRMAGAGFGRGRPVPFFGSFLETNVRLYSVDDAGRHGVVFRSLDTERLAVLPFARGVFGTPYLWAAMDLTRSGDVLTYTTRRRFPGPPARSRLVLRVGSVVEPTDLEVWLTARWGLHSRLRGRTWWVPNEHDAWPLHAAEVLALDDDLVAAAGVRPEGAALRALWSPGVRTRFGLPVRVR